MLRFVLSFLLVFLMAINSSAQESSEKITFALAIHGGAGSSPGMFSKEANQQRYESMRNALETGQQILAEGGTSLKAVETVVNLLEKRSSIQCRKGSRF